MVIAAADPAAGKNRFLSQFEERENFNQYWYSKYTIDKIVEEVEAVAGSVAFLSTPSIYYSLKSKDLKRSSCVFDLDEDFSKTLHDDNFCVYDFNKPVDMAERHKHRYDCVVVDPPFITKECWAKYAETVRHVLQPGGKIILSTIQESAIWLKEMLDVAPTPFRPSIPHLVYQYAMYTNYTPAAGLAEKNPEVPDDDD